MFSLIFSYSLKIPILFTNFSFINAFILLDNRFQLNFILDPLIFTKLPLMRYYYFLIFSLFLHKHPHSLCFLFIFFVLAQSQKYLLAFTNFAEYFHYVLGLLATIGFG